MSGETTSAIYACISFILAVLCAFVYWPLAFLFGFFFQMFLMESIAYWVAKKVMADG
jgi:putative Ca2+/H+ antiporter (TMEM165/GDT1 family)